ncbi:hypothetical protein PISMIDRAFT_550938 [Pisolithus microcarpus 441]|uniref:Uncharacterized protein n=1 Tax=Pisolithus microcarpus 441 TaxID=765257 RepID=A0A0C9YUK6_9AGAM|nr:hypothetical protein BKA83DRAFT_550938 [Pisolithus microcarpus]KIK28715.1 hypothetical protein PISMIDRAFT_550938 [Pisolithus microcarpus 441]
MRSFCLYSLMQNLNACYFCSSTARALNHFLMDNGPREIYLRIHHMLHTMYRQFGDASTRRASRAGKNSTTCVPTPLFVWTVMSLVLLVLSVVGVNCDVRRMMETNMPVVHAI